MQYIRSILLVVEPEARRPDLARRAALIARASGASVIVGVLRDDGAGELGLLLGLLPGGRGDVVEGELAAAAAEAEAEALAILRDAGVTCEAHALRGKPHAAILDAAERARVDLVIRGVGEDGVDRDSHKLVRDCRAMLWLARPGAAETDAPGPVMAAIDPQPGDGVRQALARRVVASAAALARLEARELVVVHAWRLFGEGMLRARRPGGVDDAEIDAMRDKAEAAAAERVASVTAGGPDVKVRLVKGVAGPAIAKTAHEVGADVVVIGTVGREGVAGMLLGETAEDVLRSAPCGVLSLPPRGA